MSNLKQTRHYRRLVPKYKGHRTAALRQKLPGCYSAGKQRDSSSMRNAIAYLYQFEL